MHEWCKAIIAKIPSIIFCRNQENKTLKGGKKQCSGGQWAMYVSRRPCRGIREKQKSFLFSLPTMWCMQNESSSFRKWWQKTAYIMKFQQKDISDERLWGFPSKETGLVSAGVEQFMWEPSVQEGVSRVFHQHSWPKPHAKPMDNFISRSRSLSKPNCPQTVFVPSLLDTLYSLVSPNKSSYN